MSNTSAITFSHAFATPHRLTVALPDSSHKTLLDCYPDRLEIAWTYDNLLNKPLAAFVTPATQWRVSLWPGVDGQPFTDVTWRRLGGWLPALENIYADARGTMKLEVVGGETAALVRVEMTNTDTVPHTYRLSCGTTENFGGQVPAWVDPAWDRDVMVAGWRDRADRVLFCLFGGDAYSVPAMNTFCPEWTLAPGEIREAWLVRPYDANEADVPALRNRNWGKEFAAAQAVWRHLIDQAAQFDLPDTGVRDGFYACLADLFIMREPVADGYFGTCPGTEVYRAPNAIEPGLVAVALDQLGLPWASDKGYRMEIDQQGADGNWSDPAGWCHHFWSTPGFKSWVIIEHYLLTGDQDYLAGVYPRMVASSRWQERQRAGTRVLVDGEPSLTHGLLPRGMGDAGLWDDNDMYGVFLPHNIWAVFADQCTVKAAEILGKADDLPELREIARAGLGDLLRALDRGAIAEDGYRWIPGVSGKTSGSRWGVLNVAFPCRLLPSDHELVTGTIRKLESRLSPGGLPIHLGWQPDGLWVAITLDNLAEVLLLRGEGDKAAAYLLATLNHATPLYTWCEERGVEPGAGDCAGDRQHLWTPAAVVREMRDAFMLEDGNTLHLALGTDRAWLVGGKTVGMHGGLSHFGPVDYQMQYQAGAHRVTGSVTMPPDADAEHVILHVRLPDGKRIRSVNAHPQPAIINDGTALAWLHLQETVKFTAKVE